jgi:hypothetical protein
MHIRLDGGRQYPLNPVPGLPYNRWQQHKMQDGGVAIVWFGAWTCRDGDVLVFSITAAGAGRTQAAASLGVTGLYLSGDQVKQIRRKTQEER